ncbi:MAG: hypothetical protein DRQ89_12820 [Epsilonproteobacteria bacterium]|nr:MAG: hypothetical protein DRQ89_12820 [Campylobacterota bacterium]
MANTVKIKTPHAAVIIWNYNEKLGTGKSGNVNAVNEVVISTISLKSISTSKSKGSPVGKFQLTLAPTKNWVATLTPGSWLCIMMSQTPITKEDIPGVGSAKPNKIKMIGKIEGVKLDAAPDPVTGARQTVYTVSGVDWGYIFENFIYLDPFIDPKSGIIGSTTYLELFKIMEGENGTPQFSTTDQLIRGIIDIIGKPLTKGVEDVATASNRLGKSTFAFKIPREMTRFLKIKRYGQKKSVDKTNVADLLSFISGKLTTFDDPKKNLKAYSRTAEAVGFINPTVFKGTNTLWQLLIDNSNPALNEMFTGMRWNADGTMSLALYNRIKPFIFKGDESTNKTIGSRLDGDSALTGANKKKIKAETKNLFSKFQNVRRFTIPLEDVITISAGTNWRDKYNFIEIKPSFQNPQFLSTTYKALVQTADESAFAREGFRPLITSTKQLPSSASKSLTPGEPQSSLELDVYEFAGWKELLRLWYFDTHKMLNGTVSISGQNEHIEVGDNILIDIKALGITPNISHATRNKKGKGIFMMVHVENISHEFNIGDNGARSFITNIQFVRGIITNENGQLVGRGTLDSFASSLSPADELNSVNTFGTSAGADPDPQKLRGS